MKKIVINSCYGGFGLSPLAIKRLAELEGKKCYFFKNDLKDNKHIPIGIKDIKNTLFFSAFTVPNPDEVMSSNEWSTMTPKEREKHNELYRSISLDSRPVKRDDPLLIQVVEELKDKANGAGAKLTIVEIPDGVDWEIDEYDGNEWVAENHRRWS
jgi:hypothetical protein